MTFQQAIRSVFSKYAVFTGRASRSEFWWFALLQVLVTVAVAIVGTAITGDGSNRVAAATLQLVAVLGLVLPSLAVLVRRLHDGNYSGWYALLLLIPIIGGVFVLIYTLLPSTPIGADYVLEDQTEDAASEPAPSI
jgi:uncharacterized membrane protein YhaH (DUF805 family)